MPALGSCLGLWGKLSKDLDAWVELWKYDFWVNLDKWIGKANFDLQKIDNAEEFVKYRFGSEGLHFFDRTTGLNILFDEIRNTCNPQSLAPKFVAFAITNACDLACSYCYADKRPDNLQFEKIMGWLQDLDAFGSFGVGFGGGEPTLYPQFEQLCKEVFSRTKLSISFTTHGHHLTPQFFYALQDSVHFVRISMDGVASTYEELRGRSFDKFLEKLRLLSENVPFGINVVINEKTVLELDRIYQVASDFGARELLFLPQRANLTHDAATCKTMQTLGEWIARYKGHISLLTNQVINGVETICWQNQFPDQEYAFISARGILKRTSYSENGIDLSDFTLPEAFIALQRLEAING